MPTIARKGCDEVDNLKSRDHDKKMFPNKVDKKSRNNIIQKGSEEHKNVTSKERTEFLEKAGRKRNKKDNALDVETKEKEAEIHEKLKEQDENFNEMNKTSMLKKLSGGDMIGYEFKNKKPEKYKKFFEEKEQNRGSRRSGGNNNNNTGSGTGGNYERSKWSPPGKGQPSIQFFDDQPHAYCSRQASHGGPCGWNTTHSTKYHGQALANPSFNVCTVYPNDDLALAKAKMDATGHVDAPSPPLSSEMSLNKATIQERFSRLEQTISGDEAWAVFEAMKELLN